MRWMISIVPLIVCTLLFAAGKGSDAPVNDKDYYGDTASNDPVFVSFISEGSNLNRSTYTLKELDMVVRENRNTEFVLGESKYGQKINAYYIPGTSHQKALVIAGVHGSELSAIDVACRLTNELLQGQQPYYSVIIVPALFPENAVKAISEPEQIGSTMNVGRYSYPDAVDPNRQMPSPGKAFDENNCTDHVGRKIEQENQLLLKLIEVFKPQRVANIHAIRDTSYGGIYADPRTDHNGLALGYSTDSILAVEMALFIHRQGGNVAGNKLDRSPTALYYKDPQPVAAGLLQKRNMTGSVLNAKRGSGVSFGTWGSTAIANEADTSRNRDAMRIITIEYPGYKRSSDHRTASRRTVQQKQTELFAAAIKEIFLGKYFTEDKSPEMQNGPNYTAMKSRP
ncbi:MAG: hypothetical protein JNN00_01350 [Chitinophagaceae bacterium]|nr:hypothetical protein [Chitinophagaceae bacterium]